MQEEALNETDPDIIKNLEEMMDKYEKLSLVVPYMNDVDLRYNNFEAKPIPTISAVMFCVMDVSGSMSAHHKDLGKRFFIFLYLFLIKNYEKIDIVYIRHHTQAKEVDEKEFFESRESGGTIIEPALKLAKDIMLERYLKGWNIYLAQISDGDVWGDDDAEKSKLIMEDICDYIQHVWYIEVLKGDRNTDLMKYYSRISKKNFQIGSLKEISDVWKVFKVLFKKIS